MVTNVFVQNIQKTTPSECLLILYLLTQFLKICPSSGLTRSKY